MTDFENWFKENQDSQQLQDGYLEYRAICQENDATPVSFSQWALEFIYNGEGIE